MDMPRGARRWQANAIHHAVARGHCGSSIFGSDAERAFVIARARRACEETGALCLAGAILRNHYHVLFRCTQRPSSTFSRLNTAIGIRVARARGKRGAVFEDRYYSDPCRDEASLLSRFGYVLGNPIHHGVVRSIEALIDYPWSGLGELLGRRPSVWIDIDTALACVHPDPAHARTTILEVVHAKARAWAEGAPEFDDDIDEAARRRWTLRRVGWTPDRLIQPASALARAEPDAVRAGDRSDASAAARSIVAYVACDVVGWPVSETARFLGVGPTAMPAARRGGRSRLAKLDVDPSAMFAASMK